MNKLSLRFGLAVFLLFGLFTQVMAQRPDSSAVTQLLSAGSQTITVNDMLLNETFDDVNAWESFKNDASSAKVVKGVYRMSLKGKYYTYGLNNTSDTDVIIQAETLQNSANENNSYGVMCRSNSDGAGYYFQISGDGYYNISKNDGKDFTTLVDWAQSKAINQGQNRNSITVVCVGDYLALYANDELLAETNDSDITEGYTGFTVGAYDDDGDVDISFDNAVIWSASSSASGSNNSGLPQTLDNAGGKRADVIDELEQKGLIPSGSTYVFAQNYAYFTGRGSFFTPLASRSPHKNIVMSGDLTFTVGDPKQFEACLLVARIQTDSQGTATTYVNVGLSNAGEVFIQDQLSESGDPNIQVADQTVDLSESHNVIMILQDDLATVYLDGKLAISNFTVDSRAGSYGIALIGKGAKAKCEGRNIWVYQLAASNS